MASVKFKYSDESKVYQPLIDAVNTLCKAKGKDCLCTSGYRSLEKQKIINAQSLAQRKSQGGYQTKDGAVYTPDGKCWAAAYGKSNHCYCIAMDITDNWFNSLTNTELKNFGLIKPISYEPWHVQLLAHQGISQSLKEQIRDNVLNGDDNVTVKEFQTMTGLNSDGVIGIMTKNKAKEVLKVCQEILGQDYKSANEVINACTNSPSMWLTLMSKTKYFDTFLMAIVDKLVGRK
jgi:hypothetical protein